MFRGRESEVALDAGIQYQPSFHPFPSLPLPSSPSPPTPQSGGQASTAAVAGGNGSDRSYWQGLDAILFVVDVSADMQAQDFDEGKQSYIQAAIRAVVDVMKSKIIMSESDLVGVMLYGTVNGKDPTF